MDRKQAPNVASTFDSYPRDVCRQLLRLRKLIFDVASGIEGMGALEETLKWGEPSYLARGGSTVRLGWKASRPEHYAILFNCNTKLVETFKEVYRGVFEFEGNRAIVLHKNDALPTQALKHCIEVALQYHKVKQLPLLGM